MSSRRTLINMQTIAQPETVIDRRRDLATWIATCGGIGYFPAAPGTAGSAVGVGIVLALGRVPAGSAGLKLLVVFCVVLLAAVGVWSATLAETYFGQVDPKQVVIDEVVGQMLSLCLWPRATWPWMLGGFLLFRFFDVAKPYPIRRLERARGGWGIMLDDVLAGVYSAIVLTGLRWVL